MFWHLFLIIFCSGCKSIASLNTTSIMLPENLKISYQKADYTQFTDCNPSLYNKEALQDSVKYTRSLMIAKEIRPRTSQEMAQRLPVMILFSDGFNPKDNLDKVRNNYLKCCLLRLIAHLSSTPVDIYLWVLSQNNEIPIKPAWLQTAEFASIYLMKIPDISWKPPCGIAPKQTWIFGKDLEVGYYMMGRWRLTFSLQFAKLMGYHYHLQFDADSILLNKLSQNLVNLMQPPADASSSGSSSSVSPARIARHSSSSSNSNQLPKEMMVHDQGKNVQEIYYVTFGLPEITQNWLVWRNYTPPGDVYHHFNPGGNLQSMSSETWDRLFYRGNFILLSLDFWFRDDVQDYLYFILSTHRDITNRWQEQAVMNMIRLIFVAPERLHLMSNLNLGHNRHKEKNYQIWCAAAGIQKVYST